MWVDVLAEFGYTLGRGAAQIAGGLAGGWAGTLDELDDAAVAIGRGAPGR